MTKIQCSVGILTFNSAESLSRTLDSVKDFEEIIICDGGSTDDTLDIARKYGCKIIFQDPKFKREDGKIKDFGGVRNQTLDASSHKWFFYVDSDELLSGELIEEIRSTVLNSKGPTAFWIPRKYVVNGLVIDCATTYPSKQMRLFHRDGVNRFIKTIHERIEVKEGTAVSQLSNVMLIPMTTDIKAIQKKWDYYIDLEEERVGKITVWFWFRSCFQNFKISTLYLLRLIKIQFFCQGNKMPFTLEMQRHVYHINMCKRFFKMLLVTKK
jgi:glycosyltransferase involved in cell wall biosynthesis